jgi:hypothetical protein
MEVRFVGTIEDILKEMNNFFLLAKGEITSPKFITITGEAKGEVKNETADFSVARVTDASKKTTEQIAPVAPVEKTKEEKPETKNTPTNETAKEQPTNTEKPASDKSEKAISPEHWHSIENLRKSHPDITDKEITEYFKVGALIDIPESKYFDLCRFIKSSKETKGSKPVETKAREGAKSPSMF